MSELAVAAVHRPPLLGEREDLGCLRGPQRMQRDAAGRPVPQRAGVAQASPPAVFFVASVPNISGESPGCGQRTA